MIVLITGMVIVLMGIAIWQIRNIYQLIQNQMGVEKDDSQIANEKDNDTPVSYTHLTLPTKA